jgi:hypothetical protein
VYAYVATKTAAATSFMTTRTKPKKPAILTTLAPPKFSTSTKTVRFRPITPPSVVVAQHHDDGATTTTTNNNDDDTDDAAHPTMPATSTAASEATMVHSQRLSHANDGKEEKANENRKQRRDYISNNDAVNMVNNVHDKDDDNLTTLLSNSDQVMNIPDMVTLHRLLGIPSPPTSLSSSSSSSSSSMVHASHPESIHNELSHSHAQLMLRYHQQMNELKTLYEELLTLPNHTIYRDKWMRHCAQLKLGSMGSMYISLTPVICIINDWFMTFSDYWNKK